MNPGLASRAVRKSEDRYPGSHADRWREISVRRIGSAKKMSTSAADPQLHAGGVHGGGAWPSPLIYRL